ncbi:telomeric repeat-binding factor 2-interacting protein 1 [Echeneis naucrates]|uniref:Telomeric repeat-binding factor 2-interacting protein 1 n=1 Tax=Echeneis naucrates TaxID=173247 RepID=A0A665UJV7_ECHNA|nr:telomeric repeat-binding factor 2-interacting protein 1 [Echeneis naucrates]XP_029358411.1 telomeric repeat-binding factor 2-interacting protein 1 [Echeneis naucrates]XP_029358412.1 telomeric repeat-binding factor 2-interacting protein 1 [Echeneis naucrates]XP_029358413.1 telomeric repeat-binding factor 2-interacting protein 1 [Echeneis naucrates]XP_029358414.1 telomeric repeat-binding factor 2-interacting protein 1 [Echeneis naucrates]
MSTKQEGRSKANTSSVLFMTADGEPMTFFLRPGPVKRKLQPLITSGGGMLCNVQQPGAILLIDPEERGSIFESTAHWYVSTNYISDCTERKERLNIEDYRLNPEVVPRHSTRLKNKGSSSVLGGRIPYTPEDDAAILNYVCNHKNDTGGNQLWQAMEKEHVTNHSWQSMKYRYRVKLAKKLSTAKEVKIDKETKKEGNQETAVQKPLSEDASPPQTHLAETDPIQVDAQPIPAEITQPENVEAGTSNSHQSGMLCLDPPTHVHPVPAESKQTEAAEPIKTTSPQEETVSDYSLQSCHCSSTPENHKQPKQSPSAELEQPQRRLTRRQLEHEMSSLSEPYSKKLRSSTSVDKQVLSPQSTKKTRPPVVKQTIDSPPPKRPRVNGVAAVAAVAERQQDESEEAAIFETPEAEQPEETTAEELKLLPQTVEKKKGKKKLGILELATKEFEDESESAGSETQDLENPTETAAAQLTSTESLVPPTDQAVGPTSTQSDPAPETGFQEKARQPQASSSNSVSEPAATEAVHVSGRAHKFIFDRESQEECSQSLLGSTSSALSNPQPPVDKDVEFSLTQVQLEEDKRRIRELMDQTNQDLASVTKALLRTSGDFSAALDVLLDPSSISGPFWNQHDDSLLRSADPVLLLQLKEKYSEEEVAKRTVFLEVGK